MSNQNLLSNVDRGSQASSLDERADLAGETDLRRMQQTTKKFKLKVLVL